MFLTSPNLAGIPHGFFTRRGGVSHGIYASLNCGLGTHDSMANALENRSRVARVLGTTGDQLLSLYQVHGDTIILAEKPWSPDDRPHADAMLTTTPGLALGVLAADCVPVLYADEKRSIVAAAHSGWKGTLKNVAGRTVAAMKALGSDPASIKVAIGPCIAQASYEVDTGFRDRFLATDAAFAQYFVPGKGPEHFMFDIRGCVRDLLLRTGVTDINTLENDTYIEEDGFFSFRRATHRNEPDYGRQISAIMLKP